MQQSITGWLWGAWLILCWACANAQPAPVLILKSREGALYEPVVQSLVNELKRKTPDLNPPIFSLTGSKTDAEIVRNLLERKPRVIVAIGTDAALQLKQHTESLPESQRPIVVFTMVLDPVALGLVPGAEQSDSHFVGVALTVRPQRQFRALLDVAPQARRIGVVYNPNDATSTRLIQQARDDAEKLGIQLVEASATKPEEVPQALNALKNQIDAFWLIPDPVCAAPQPFQQIQAFVSERKLPLLAFSDSYVRRGALMAVGPDLAEQGVLAAELVQQILNGTPAETLPLLTPRRLLSYYNTAQARRIGIAIPDMLLNLAEKVFDQ